jgi:NADH-quinone oxidoreductase subunit M
MIAWPLYITFATPLLLALMPVRSAVLARWIALLSSAVSLVISFCAIVNWPGGRIEIAHAPWISPLGISWFLAADGISATLVLLTSIAALAGVLFSWNVEHRVREFFSFYFLLLGGVYGVFLSYDLFLLFVFYEIAIIPKYFLIAIWGSTRREYGAMKLALYSFVGSGLVLIGIVGVYVVTGERTMSLIDLSRTQFPASFQVWAFPVTFIGFAILAGLWPFHTWAPTGHVAAPTAASMMLAGVVMKLGAYGAFRVSVSLFPDGAKLWQTPFAVLAVIGIVYGAMVALTQNDFKFVIGYSSVSHMGFVILGLMTLNTIGVSGAVLQMFSHGIIAGLLFAVVGRIVYDRTHTRDFPELQHFALGRALPIAAIIFLLAALASMGFPGFSGFVAELSILLGAWSRFPVLTIIAGFGILVGVAFMLRALQKSFFTEPLASEAGEAPEALAPLTFAEKAGALLLLVSTIAVGVYPRFLLKLITSSVSELKL